MSGTTYNNASLDAHVALFVKPDAHPRPLWWQGQGTFCQLSPHRCTLRRSNRAHSKRRETNVYVSQQGWARLTFCKNRKMRLMGCTITFCTPFFPRNAMVRTGTVYPLHTRNTHSLACRVELLVHPASASESNRVSSHSCVEACVSVDIAAGMGDVKYVSTYTRLAAPTLRFLSRSVNARVSLRLHSTQGLTDTMSARSDWRS